VFALNILGFIFIGLQIRPILESLEAADRGQILRRPRRGPADRDLSWAGMRGIVSLAAAMALPPAFPYRDLIVLTAFSVVLGTLVIQGLTLKPLLRALDLHDDDPVGRELRAARERALRAALASVAGDRSSVADAMREEFTIRLAPGRREGGEAIYSAHAEIRRAALQAARQAVLAMRANDEIGDDDFHLMEEELDWLEMAVGRKPD
jgi:NhaP-type Na+/H+ or K+/H+ antiporter